MTHNACNSEINLEQLAGIIPFIVAVDERLTVTWASEPVLRRVGDALSLGVSDIVEPVKPREELSPSSIARNRGMKHEVSLKNRDGSVSLIGEWFPTRNGFLLLAGPDVRKQGDLDRFSVDDFPEGDPITELMKVREEHVRSLREAKSAVDALRDKNRAIRESNQGLELANAELEKEAVERRRVGEDLKKAQTELIQTEKLASLGQLAAGIAHEINTPSQFVGDNIRFLRDAHQDLHKLISSLTEFLSSAKRGEASGELVRAAEKAVEEADLEFLFEEIPKAIEQSQEGVQRIGHIVRSMKQFSHPGAKDKTLSDINACIETTVIVCRNEWKYVAGMVTNLDRSVPLVPLYQNEFNQVILNIILNATLAIKEKVGDSPEDKGTIGITTSHGEKFAEVRIRDTGAGIPEDIRGKIFDPFFTSREVGKGTGQGLAISHSVIVEKHGGTLSFETEVGGGTTFIIRLPLEAG